MKKSYLLKIIKEEITNALAEDANADKAARDAQKVAIQKQMVALQKKLADLAKGGNMNENELEEDQLNEMAKISGELESAIRKVIVNNHDLEGLALKKKIKADEAVIDALEGDDLYDNQLNKFIALTRGERTLAQRGRKPSETPTPKTAPKSSPAKPQSKPEDKAEEKAKEGAGDKFSAKGDKYGELKMKLAGVISDMKDTAADYRKAEGAKKTELTKKLKSLSASKETIEKEMASLKKI